jgi:isopentenyl-diphosphate delta-isomerase
MKNDKLLLVDENDNVIGFESKEKCHEGRGLLHRAFSAFIFNSKGQLLIHQRSKFKKLWPLYWSNSFCSHPRKGETYEKAAERRGKEELGIECKMKYLYKFQYYAPFKNIGCENELCAVLIGKYDGKISPNPKEIADWKFVDIDELKKDIAKNPDKYTPWFKMELKRLMKDFKKDIENLIYSRA